MPAVWKVIIYSWYLHHNTQDYVVQCHFPLHAKKGLVYQPNYQPLRLTTNPSTQPPPPITNNHHQLPPPTTNHQPLTTNLPPFPTYTDLVQHSFRIMKFAPQTSPEFVANLAISAVRRWAARGGGGRGGGGGESGQKEVLTTWIFLLPWVDLIESTSSASSSSSSSTCFSSSEGSPRFPFPVSMSTSWLPFCCKLASFCRSIYERNTRTDRQERDTQTDRQEGQRSSIYLNLSIRTYRSVYLSTYLTRDQSNL